jgi:hypothetical protein
MNIKDHTGERFGKLTAIKFLRRDNEKNRTYWLFKCDCGKEKIATINNLKKGVMNSCGCYVIDHCREMGKRSGAKNGRKNAKKDSGLNKMYYAYKVGAKNRSLVFDITKEDFKKITSLYCFYCGKEPSNVSKKNSTEGIYIYNGLDRINNNKGYTIDNVIPCCFKCNRMKSTLNQEDFLNQIKKVHAHLKLS